jgi:hypothetical protein
MQRQFHVGAQNDALFITSGRPPASTNDYPDHDADRTCVARIFDESEARRLVQAANAATAEGIQSVDEINALLEIETGWRVELAQSIGGEFLRLMRRAGAAEDEWEAVGSFPRETGAGVFCAMGGLSRHYYALGERKANLP